MPPSLCLSLACALCPGCRGGGIRGRRCVCVGYNLHKPCPRFSHLSCENIHRHKDPVWEDAAPRLCVALEFMGWKVLSYRDLAEASLPTDGVARHCRSIGPCRAIDQQVPRHEQLALLQY